MKSDKENTMILTFKIVVPNKLHTPLDALHTKSKVCVKRMLENRRNSSSKHYPEIPAILSKSLIRKYQKNKKLKAVKSLVLPISGGESGVNFKDGRLIIKSFFGKDCLNLHLPYKMTENRLRGLEFFKRDGVWFLSYSYKVLVQKQLEIKSVIGVDRNSKGNVATIANTTTGKVKKLGPCTQSITANFRNRRAKLQKKGAIRALKKIKRNQSRVIKDINHKVSKQIVKEAQSTSSALVLEDLKSIRKGKARRYVEKSQWSYFQLMQFIQYKATLAGVPVFFVDPRNTSKGCSRCGQLNMVTGKRFTCKNCGHVDHRDVNAAFNIGKRWVSQTVDERVSAVGFIGDPLNLVAEKAVKQESPGGAQ